MSVFAPCLTSEGFSEKSEKTTEALRARTFTDAKADFDSSVFHLKRTISVLGQAMNSAVPDAGHQMAQVLSRADVCTALPKRDLRSMFGQEFEELVQLQRLGACPANSQRLWQKPFVGKLEGGMLKMTLQSLEDQILSSKRNVRHR